LGIKDGILNPEKNELGIKGGILNPRKIIASKVNNLEVLLLSKGCQEHYYYYYLLFQLYTVLHYCMSRSQKSSTTHTDLRELF